jgi:hypothetical protein
MIEKADIVVGALERLDLALDEFVDAHASLGGSRSPWLFPR